MDISGASRDVIYFFVLVYLLCFILDDMSSASTAFILSSGTIFFLLTTSRPSNILIRYRQGTDSGVDTYFGLCTYPGRELRHRIDLKVLD